MRRSKLKNEVKKYYNYPGTVLSLDEMKNIKKNEITYC